MIISKTAKVKWNARNKKRLVELGYVFTKMNDEVEVNIEHLSKGSNATITLKCDYCGEHYTNIYEKYIRKNKDSSVEKDCCEGCLQLKAQDGIVAKYGVKNPMMLKEVREKGKQTNLKKYGVENPFQSEEIKEKIIQTNIEKYGVKSYRQTKECQEKYEATCLKKYGAVSHMKTKKYRLMFTKENSPRWKGGVAHHRVERMEYDYRMWRKQVFERDRFTCQCCGKNGGTYLQSHHLYNWRDYPDKRYDVENGMTLCKECHLKFHSVYGKKNNTPEQMQSFIKNYDKNVCRTATNHKVAE